MRLSVIIPGYNRTEPLKYTLRSAAAALARLDGAAELLLVDDGSTPELAAQLGAFESGHPVVHLRQPNQGSIIARQIGLAAATGEYVHFLDSDDLVHPDKYRVLLALLSESGADLAYDDLATATLGPDYTVTRFEPVPSAPAETQPARFFLRLQPAPHAPVYRRNYLRACLDHPLIPARREMDPAGDAWLYYNLAAHPARIVKARAFYTAPGPHDEDRYSRSWERLGAAALPIMETFQRLCPATPATEQARTVAGEAAFLAWRALPRGFHAGFARRTLQLWRQSPRGPLNHLGGSLFCRLGRLCGPLAAARLLRVLQSRPYSRVRTLSPEAAAQLFRQLDDR